MYAKLYAKTNALDRICSHLSVPATHENTTNFARTRTKHTTVAPNVVGSHAILPPHIH